MPKSSFFRDIQGCKQFVRAYQKVYVGVERALINSSNFRAASADGTPFHGSQMYLGNLHL